MELTCSTWGEKLKRKRKMWRQTGFVQILPVDRGWFLHHHLHSSSPRHLSLLTFLPSHYSLLSLWSPLFISSTIHLPPPRSCLLSITRLVSYSSISISLLHDFCKILKSLVTFGEHSQDNCLVQVCSVSPLREYPHFGLINKPWDFDCCSYPASDQLSTPWSQSVLKTELHCLTIVIVTHSLLYCSN